MFDTHMQERRSRRAQQRAKQNGASFLVQRAAEDAASRLLDINRTFQRALFIGQPNFMEQVLLNLPPEKHPKQCEFDHYAIGQADDAGTPAYDLVISGLALHGSNDPLQDLSAARKILKADGLMMACLFGRETLQELRQAFYQADDLRFGGQMPRIYPFTDHTGAAALLERAGFALPVVDIDRFTVTYKNLHRLIVDIRDLGESNSLTQRHRAYLGKAYFTALEKAYKRSGDAKTFPASFEILWLTGWTPLPPG